MKRHHLLIGACLLLPAMASAEGFNVSVRASTLGLGGEVGYAFNDYVNLRVGLNQYTYDYETTEDGIEYDFDFDLDSTALLLDVHPFAGSFRITAGMLDNGNELNGQAVATGTYEIGDETYTGEEAGTLYSNIELGDSNPLYLGVGWSKALADSGWGFGFDIGAVMLGDSSVNLTPQGGTLVGNEAFQDDIAAEEAALEDDINESFDVYPVAAIGFTFQF